MAGGPTAQWPYAVPTATNGLDDLLALLNVQGAGAQQQTENAFLALTAAAFGATNFAWTYDEFADAVIGAKWNILNTPAIALTYGGGAVTCLAPTNMIHKSGTGWLQTPRTKKWAVGGRAQFSLAGAAGDQRRFALSNGGTSEVAVGYNNDRSTTKFSARLNNAGAITGAASTVTYENALLHTFFMYSNAVSVFFSVDGEKLITVGPVANLPTATLFERHGTEAATNGTMTMDAAFTAVERQA